ncbi:MAG: TolC family protein [Treponema sp.]|nr:TolC family protein [Treponema sp.]
MILRKQACSLIFLMVMLSLQAWRANAVTLTVDDAVDHALEGNLSIKQSDIALRTSQRAKTFSWNSVAPSVSVNAQISKSLPATGLLKNDADYSKDPTISIGGSVNMKLHPSVGTTVKGASLNYEKQQLDYNTAVRTVELNVRETFYGILFEQENISLLEKNLETAKEIYGSNVTKYNKGLLPRLDVLNSQLSYQNAKTSLESAKVTLENDKSVFKQLLGLDLDTDITLDGSLDDILSIDDISIDELSNHSSEVASIEKEIQIANNNLLAARLSAYGPTLSGSYSYNLNKSLSDGADWMHGGTLSVGVSIPLDGFMPWSSGVQSIANQKDNIESLKLKLENAKLSLKINCQSYMNKINQLQSTISLRRQSIDYAKQSYDLTLDAYNNGKKDILTLQNASDSLFQARVNLKSEAYSLIKVILELENTIGVPFGTLSKKEQL